MSTSESSVLKRDVVMCYNDMLKKLITNHFSKKFFYKTLTMTTKTVNDVSTTELV